MVPGWLLLIVMALPTVTTGTKLCYACDMTQSSNCTSIIISCLDDERCFTSRGMIPGVGPVINKGCKLTTFCDHRDDPVLYKHITYKLVSTCCRGELCNRAALPAGSRAAGATTGLALGLLLLQ